MMPLTQLEVATLSERVQDLQQHPPEFSRVAPLLPGLRYASEGGGDRVAWYIGTVRLRNATAKRATGLGRGRFLDGETRVAAVGFARARR